MTYKLARTLMLIKKKLPLISDGAFLVSPYLGIDFDENKTS